jgi:hypothetical protein
MSSTLTTRFSVAAAAALLAWNLGVAATDSPPPGSPAAAHSAPAAPASAAPSAVQGSTGSESAPPGAEQNWKMVTDYCQKCHNAEDWAGGIAFDTMTPADISDNAETWEKAVRKLQGRLMPPPGKKQPPADTIHSFVHWMEGTLDAAADKSPPDPGRVALHRLNRKEYANAVWDLLAVKVDPARCCRPTT